MKYTPALTYIIFCYFENILTLISTLLLAYSCYYDSFMVSDEEWKFYLSIMLFIWLVKMIGCNFMYFADFIYFDRIKNGKMTLFIHQFLVMQVLYYKKIPFSSNIFNIIIPKIIGFFDCLFYCSTSQIKLLMHFCSYSEFKEKYVFIFKIMLIGLIFLDIPTMYVSTQVIIKGKITFAYYCGILGIIRLFLTFFHHVYTILSFLKYDNIREPLLQ